MKKMMILAMMMTIAISASAMTYNEARSEALFLSDKMAYELGLDDAQYEAVYRLNLDYLMGLNGRSDLYGSRWSLRDRGLVRVLTPAQYSLYVDRHYFYRPVTWSGRAWVFNIYNRYHRNHFFRHHPVAHHSLAAPRYGHPAAIGPRPGHRHHFDHRSADHGRHHRR